jgi:uncharacterized protein (DUF983 family)
MPQLRIRPAPVQVTGFRRTSFRRVLRGRCPQCGRGELFERWARLRDRCSVCGLIYRREPGAELGSMYLSATVSQLFAAGVFLVLWLGTSWSATVSLAVSLPVVIAFCYGILPTSMAVWTAVEYVTDVGSREWWAKPRP